MAGLVGELAGGSVGLVLELVMGLVGLYLFSIEIKK
jgi:hypothetical protein